MGKRNQTTPTRSGFTPNEKKRRGRRIIKHNNRQPIEEDLATLEKMSMVKLQSYCDDRGLDKRAKSKLVLIGRLLPFVKEANLDQCEDFEIAEYCNVLGVSTIGYNKREQLAAFLKNEREQTQTYSRELEEEFDTHNQAELLQVYTTERTCETIESEEELENQTPPHESQEMNSTIAGEMEANDSSTEDDTFEQDLMDDTHNLEIPLFLPKQKPTFLEKRKQRMKPTAESQRWVNEDLGPDYKLLGSCDVLIIDEYLNQLPFFQTVFGSHEQKVNISKTSLGREVKNGKGKLINVRLSKTMPYTANPDLVDNDILYYETLFCKHPSCVQSSGHFLKRIGRMKYQSNCSAKGKIVIYNGDITKAHVFGKGRHDPSFIPSKDPKRITPNQKQLVLHSYRQFNPKPSQISKVVGLDRQQVTSLIQYEKRSKQLTKDPFASFLGRLEELNKEEGFSVLVPGDTTLYSMNESNYIVLIIKDELVEMGIKHGKGTVIQGIDTVHKITSFQAPINVIATVDNNFKGVLQAISISHNNDQNTLSKILSTFVTHIRQKYGHFQPRWMIDAAQANIAAMKKLGYEYNLCRFHVSERWRKHLSKVPSAHQSEIGKLLVQMGVSKEEESYKKAYGTFQKYCGRTSCTKTFLEYFNQKFHNCYSAWIAKDRVLDMNSIGNTNNVCESQIRLLEEAASDRAIQRIDYLVEPIVQRLNENLRTLGDETIPLPKTVKEFNKRLERGIEY